MRWEGRTFRTPGKAAQRQRQRQRRIPEWPRQKSICSISARTSLMRSLKWDDFLERSPVDEVRTKTGKEQPRGEREGDEVKTGKKGGPLASRTSAPIKGLGTVCHSFSSFLSPLRCRRSPLSAFLCFFFYYYCVFFFFFLLHSDSLSSLQ